MKVSRGVVADELAAEHPGLWLAWTEVEADSDPTRPTPPELRERLRAMADRMRGPDAIAMRRRDVPHAYRVFFRHVGLDPDVVRTPVEAIVLRRMREGGLRPQGLVADALTVATLETGVGVWALDAEAVSGPLALREAGGRLVLADDAGPLAVLFDEPRSRAVPGKGTRRLLLAAVAVPGVAAMSVEEALWTASDILAGGRTAAG